MSSSSASSEKMPSNSPENDEIAERLRAVLVAAGASGTWDWDIRTDTLYFDERMAELYGVDPAVGQRGCPTSTFFKAIHPSDRPRMKIAVAGILGGSELFSKEFRVQRPDGSVLWMHGRGHGHSDGDDKPIRFTGLLVDVTERKRTEERLRIAQTAGGVGTFEYNDGFATASVSDEFCRLLGLHPARVLPIRTINAVVCDGESPIIPTTDQHGAVMGNELEGEFRIVRADDGLERWIARRGEVIRDTAGDEGGYRFIGVIYDVTSAKEIEERLQLLNATLEARVAEEIAVREQAEEALRQAQKMEAVGRLTGGIAHDFNNLLTIIIGNIDTVVRAQDAGWDSKVRRSLDNAQKGAERAAALTQRLLAFSRRQPLNPKQTDVARLLVGMTDLLTRSIRESIAIDIQPAADAWRVEVDPHQLENAILNLVLNARDAMQQDGRVTITADNLTLPDRAAPGLLPGGAYVRISVKDNGSGMAPETVANVFDPFFTTKEVGQGTGLGLSMVYGFAKQSGGHVEVESSLGAGTTVSIYLPRLAEVGTDETDEGASLPERQKHSETIMVVEDDADVRAYTVDTLRELGYEVVEGADGPSALTLLQELGSRVDLLLTDVIMPAMSGPELADTAHSILPDLKVLYTSGYTREAIMQNGRLEQGVDLLSKPFTYVSLATKVRDVLDRQSNASGEQGAPAVAPLEG